MVMEFRSMQNFRLLNRCARKFVDSVPEYAAIAKHCPGMFHPCLYKSCCKALFTLLRGSECSVCKVRPGGYLDMHRL